jgi:nodulation protein E
LKKAVVTGLGCISALGADVSSNWSAVLNGKCGVKKISIRTPGVDDLCFDGVAAPVDIDPSNLLSKHFTRRLLQGADRFSLFGAVATLEALIDAGFTLPAAEMEEAAIIFGSASGGLVTMDSSYGRLFRSNSQVLHPLTIPRLMTSAPASVLSMLFGVRGLTYAIASACASSAHAIGEAVHLVRTGRANLVLAGGTDASLTYGSLRSWDALQATSATACRPFSADRDGTVLGEGAATLIIEEEDSAKRRGARIYAEIAGVGYSTDAEHLTQPSSAQAAKAIGRAHADAGLAVDHPLLISAHGTGTLLNDRSEAAALRAVYGVSLDQHVVIATKSAHGHLLGATGALELLLGIVAMQEGVAPPVLGFNEPDPECCLPLALKPTPMSKDALLSTSFAFGGLNCALLARRHQDFQSKA